MPIIKISESGSDSETGIFRAKVSVDDGPERLVEVRNPFQEAEEERLEWYFEEHLRQPYLNRVKARTAAESVRSYRERLFHQMVRGSRNGADFVPYAVRDQPPITDLKS